MANSYKRWGVDISKWQEKVDWVQLVAGGMDFAFIKGTMGYGSVDSMFETHYKAARAAGVPYVGMYHWADPSVDWKAQADGCIALAKKHKVDMIAMDIEQDWSTWSDQTKKVSPDKLNTFNKTLFDYVKANSGIRTIIYTGHGFIEGRCPAMDTWIGKEGTWWAQYPNTSYVWLFNVCEIRNRIAQLTIPSIWYHPVSVDIWQFGSTIMFPFDNTTSFDVNVWVKSDAEFYKFWGKEPATPVVVTTPVVTVPVTTPVVVPTPTTTVASGDYKNPYGLNFRASPEDGYVMKTLPANTKFKLLTDRPAWVQIQLSNGSIGWVRNDLIEKI